MDYLCCKSVVFFYHKKRMKNKLAVLSGQRVLAQLETDPQSMDWMEKTLQSGAKVD